LIAEIGRVPAPGLLEAYPALDVTRYAPGGAREAIESALEDADLVIVHEWTAPEIVREIGALRSRPGARFKLLFHDTHHRAVSDVDGIAAFDLSGYDGVLAFGESVRERYLKAGWARRAWVFHEAADVRVFKPRFDLAIERDLCFVGNWGDGERSAEIEEFVLEPAAALGLTGTVHGVRYPEQGVRAVARSGLSYGGWVANHHVPEVFARHLMTIHVPRRPYARALPGIPTIRVFEALASGIPLVSAPWSDVEGLFRSDDFLRVGNREEAVSAMRRLRDDPAEAAELARRGRETILARHTCEHRAHELLAIARSLGAGEHQHGAGPSRRIGEQSAWG
jgi:spore maturation protein CgeB